MDFDSFNLTLSWICHFSVEDNAPIETHAWQSQKKGLSRRHLLLGAPRKLSTKLSPDNQVMSEKSAPLGQAINLKSPTDVNARCLSKRCKMVAWFCCLVKPYNQISIT